MSGKSYFPNNWEAFKETPEEAFPTPTWIEFEEHKLCGWELPSSICCIIRATTPKGKIKEYVYQQERAAEKRVVKLRQEGASYTVVTQEQIMHVRPATEEELEHYLD